MATTNNVQGDEPRPTALERQVQTLTAAVERITKQNQDLKEKLRQKNAGHGTQQEDQEGTNAERRDQEGPEGSNAPSRPEQQDMNRPSITDMAPPHIRLWEHTLAIPSLPGQKVAWYLPTQWQPPTTFRETSHDLLPWRGKSKPSQQQWNASPNRIKT